MMGHKVYIIFDFAHRAEEVTGYIQRSLCILEVDKVYIYL